MDLARPKTRTPTNLVNPMPIKTEDPVFSRVVFSFYDWVPFKWNIEMQIWAVNYTDSPTHVIKLTT